MASSYVNNLRLNEMATGDASGTWGTITNTNLELIGEALGFGTEAITTNADTHTSTVADGASDGSSGNDGARAMYLKYTGTLDSACTITIAPNDIRRLQFIENGTSGSQNIIISQGSGANVTIPPGDTKAVYLDGAGSGAAVVDAFASLNVVDLKVEDDLTLTSDSAVITFGADGDTTLTHTDGSGLTLNSTNKIMFNDASQFIHGSSAAVLSLGATDEIDLTATAIDVNGTMDVSGAITSSAGMTITTADNSDTLTLKSTDADASTGANLVLQRDSASPADNDLTGTIKFKADNDGGEVTDFVSIFSRIEDASDGSEDGSLLVNSIVGGSQVSRFNITPTEIAINDDGSNLDFRVEGNNSANLLFIDADSDHICMNTSTDAGGVLNIKTTDNTTNLVLFSTDTDSGVGPILSLSRNNDSAADEDLIGQIHFFAEDDGNNQTKYAEIFCQIADASNGSEDGRLSFNARDGGSNREFMRMEGSLGIVINEEGDSNLNFRVESDGNANMINVDSGNNIVGIARVPATSDGGAGSLQIEGNDGVAFRRNGQTNSFILRPVGSSDGMRFTQGGVGDRMQIDASGRLLIGTGAAISAAGGAIFQSSQSNNNWTQYVENFAGSGAVYGQLIRFSGQSRDDNTSAFFQCVDSGETVRLVIYSDGDVYNHDGTFAQISDRRIKDNITDANSQWNDIKGMRFVNYQRKDDIRQYGESEAKVQLGLIGQELETVSPNLVRSVEPSASDILGSSEFGTLYTSDDAETKDGNDAVLYTKEDVEVQLGQAEVGDIKTKATHSKEVGDVKETKDKVKGVAYSILYMKAVKALQEAMTRIETLEASNIALEARITTLESA